MELDTVEIHEGLVFIPEVLDDDYYPNEAELARLSPKWSLPCIWNEGEEQCPNCGDWETEYLYMHGCYCEECGILWKWRIVR